MPRLHPSPSTRALPHSTGACHLGAAAPIPTSVLLPRVRSVDCGPRVASPTLYPIDIRMFCCVSAISLDITFQALKAVRRICVKLVRSRACTARGHVSRVRPGRAAAPAHTTHSHTRDESREAYHILRG
eukprot:scaffold4832_cov42-Phaeocystis_antarctica.AAC.1